VSEQNCWQQLNIQHSSQNSKILMPAFQKLRIRILSLRAMKFAGQSSLNPLQKVFIPQTSPPQKPPY
jgi:hypothetical protein